jgi:hypothetical protein
MRKAIIEQQINLTVFFDNGASHHYTDVSSIIFDGRDAIIQLRDRCLVKNARLFDNMFIKVVDREEPIEEDLIGGGVYFN